MRDQWIGRRDRQTRWSRNEEVVRRSRVEVIVRISHRDVERFP